MSLLTENGNDILKLEKISASIVVGGWTRSKTYKMMNKGKQETERPRIPRIFERNPELKKRIEAYLDSIPREKKAEDLKKFEKFVSGELTWAEIKKYPKGLLKLLARAAYLKFNEGAYEVAESIFKGLAIIDHHNWYYRVALGAIYQKQKLYEQAIEEYSMALELNEKEITSLVNRGECYLHLENQDAALDDLKVAVALDPEEKNAWGKRAKQVLNRIERKN